MSATAAAPQPYVITAAAAATSPGSYWTEKHPLTSASAQNNTKPANTSLLIRRAQQEHAALRMSEAPITRKCTMLQPGTVGPHARQARHAPAGFQGQRGRARGVVLLLVAHSTNACVSWGWSAAMHG